MNEWVCANLRFCTARGNVSGRKRNQGLGWRGTCLMGIEFQFYKMKRVTKIDGGDGPKTVWMYVTLMLPVCKVKVVTLTVCVFYDNKNIFFKKISNHPNKEYLPKWGRGSSYTRVVFGLIILPYVINFIHLFAVILKIGIEA